MKFNYWFFPAIFPSSGRLPIVVFVINLNVFMRIREIVTCGEGRERELTGRRVKAHVRVLMVRVAVECGPWGDEAQWRHLARSCGLDHVRVRAVAAATTLAAVTVDGGLQLDGRAQPKLLRLVVVQVLHISETNTSTDYFFCEKPHRWRSDQSPKWISPCQHNLNLFIDRHFLINFFQEKLHLFFNKEKNNLDLKFIDGCVMKLAGSFGWNKIKTDRSEKCWGKVLPTFSDSKKNSVRLRRKGLRITPEQHISDSLLSSLLATDWGNHVLTASAEDLVLHCGVYCGL